MILSDRDIKRELREGDLNITNITDLEKQIQPASVDMRLGNTFITFESSNVPYIDPTDDLEEYNYTQEIEIDNDENFVIHPDDFILGTTIETVEMPANLIAEVNGRSSMGRLGVMVHATAGVVDPGYEGEITLELSNTGKTPISLTPEMRICQLLFTELKSECEKPYGEERNSKYQGQEGPKQSKISEDPDI